MLYLDSDGSLRQPYLSKPTVTATSLITVTFVWITSPFNSKFAVICWICLTKFGVALWITYVQFVVAFIGYFLFVIDGSINFCD
jgi:hypothetical protein